MKTKHTTLTGSTTHSEQELEKKIKEIIKANIYGYEHKECRGTGANGQDECLPCKGTGIVDWELDLGISKIKELIQSEREKMIEEVIRLRPDYYTKDQLEFYDKAPQSYDLKKDSPEWYNLALSQWEKRLAKLAQKEEK